jgi:hypothetical protein
MTMDDEGCGLLGGRRRERMRRRNGLCGGVGMLRVSNQ